MRILAAALTLGLLTACVSDREASWDHDTQITVEQSTITLTPNLWQNKMVGIGVEEESQHLYGALMLASQQDLPAGLDVTSVQLKQSDQTFLIDPKDFEIRVHNEQQWEVAFKARVDVDVETRTDILMTVSHEGQTEYLAAQQVQIEKVY